MKNSWFYDDSQMGAQSQIGDTPVDSSGHILANEAEVRTIMSAFAALIPHHEVEEFGKIVDDLQLDVITVHKVELKTLYEGRVASRKQKPYSGWKIPPLRFTKEDVDPWHYNYEIASKYSKLCVENLLVDSQQVNECGTCRASGRVDCHACKGKKQVGCPSCKKSGTQSCKTCTGTGKTAVSRVVGQRTVHCTSIVCRGGRTLSGVVCMWCNGTGLDFRDVVETTEYQCATCRGSGKIKCLQCKGATVVTCEKCAGDGMLECSKCAGYGQMVSYIEIQQMFDPHARLVIIPESECPPEAILQIDEAADYSLLFCEGEHQLNVEHAINAKSSVLQATIAQAIQQSRSTLDARTRISGQTLKVSNARIIHARYKLQGRAYDLWVVGSLGRVYAPTSPFTEAVANKISHATKLWSAKSRMEASALLRDAREMAAADKHCQNVIERMNDDVPILLKASARAYSSFDVTRKWIQKATAWIRIWWLGYVERRSK